VDKEEESNQQSALGIQPKPFTAKDAENAKEDKDGQRNFAT